MFNLRPKVGGTGRAGRPTPPSRKLQSVPSCLGRQDRLEVPEKKEKKKRGLKRQNSCS
uniref:Uncharacterized protein n=1 Tax=Astyanax mexicanus TaxID=7994 RepID=A0A3B1JU97_ASTMX